jgi:hypothetical protein
MSHFTPTALSHPATQQCVAPPPIVKKTENLNEAGHFANGFFANANMVVAMQPLFTLKTHLMSGKGLPPLSKLYHGLPVNILTGGPAEGLTFLAHHISCRLFKGETHLTEGQNLAASALSGAIGAAAIAPCERVMILQQLGRGTMSHVMKPVILKEGWIRAFSKGLVPTAGRDAGYNCGIFALNDMAHQRLKSRIPDESTREVAASALCGSIIGALTTPFDVIKTRMQADTEGECNSFLKTTRNIIKMEGVKTLFYGVRSRAALIAGATYCIYKSKKELPPHFPSQLFKTPG